MKEPAGRQQEVAADLTARMRDVVRKVTAYNPHADQERLWRAFHLGAEAHAGQRRESGEPFFMHELTVADLLADLRQDTDTLIAGLLHDVVEDTTVQLAAIAEAFGGDVAALVDGVTKIGGLRSRNPERLRAENHRKLVLSIAKDPRVVLIKLADRLHNMRTIQYLARDRQQEMAQETLDVYAPLAHRFGIGRVKWELEDRAFKVLHPERYFEIESGINQSRAERERLLEEVRRPLGEAMRKAGLEAEISGRAKNFYSIHRKMQTQQIGLDRIYDLLALRIIVPTKADCYHALGIVHSLYPPLADRIKDYIATPKANLYQSLHTTVRVPGGRYLEVQIRTPEMHAQGEMGIASHWLYKEGGGDSEAYNALLRALREVMEWQQDVADPREFMEILKLDFLQDDIFVFSPMGDVFQLPRGATPLDFAFHVHSEVGLHCIGAKVNGRVVNLRTPLQNLDTVEVLTNRSAHPSTSWLEIVKTSRAKHHLRRWIKQSQYQHSVKLGREIVERELARRKLRLKIDRDLVDVAQQMGYSELEKLLAAIGSGDIPHQRLFSRLEPRPASPAEKVADLSRDLYASMFGKRVGGVRLQGVDNLMVRFARCCQPIPGDEVMGVVTRGRGVSVHRASCPNLTHIEPERQLEVTWDVDPEQTFQVKLLITAADRKNLLADLSQAISALGTNIQSGDFAAEDDLAQATFLLEVRNLNNLEKILNALRRVPSVQKVERFQL